MRAMIADRFLEQVNGGVVLDPGNGWFYVADDNDGFVMTITNINKEYAMWAAKMNGQSSEEITTEEYERRFGKAFYARIPA